MRYGMPVGAAGMPAPQGDPLRTLFTFILRLWIDPQAEEPAWEGQVECVADGARAHVRSAEELARFIAAATSERITKPPSARQQEE